MSIPVFIVLIGIILIMIINDVSIIELLSDVITTVVMIAVTAGLAYSTLCISDKVVLDMDQINYMYILSKSFWGAVFLSGILVIMSMLTIGSAIVTFQVICGIFITLFTNNRQEENVNIDIAETIADNEDTNPDLKIIDGGNDGKDDN